MRMRMTQRGNDVMESVVSLALARMLYRGRCENERYHTPYAVIR